MDQIALTSTETLHPNDKQDVIPTKEYSTAQQHYINFKRQRLIAARDARDMVRDEYDGMNFLQYVDVLKKHDDQYIAPRKNKTDTAINTGTIRDKDTTLVEYATKYDFEPVAQCYNEDDDIMEELADTGEDMVRKSLILEDMRSKAKLIYRSMVAFGTAYVEDQWVERWTIEKQIGKGFKVGAANATWTEKKVKQYDGCQSKLWDIRKCYPGDVRKFFMNGPQGQPYFFTVEYETYAVTKQMFGDWDEWKYVPNVIVNTPEASAAQNFASGWTLRPVTLNTCEIIRYYDPIMNEYGISINGIEMLPLMSKIIKENGMDKETMSGYPLTVISSSGAIPFAKYDLEPMHEWWMSKSQPGKMRVWGDVENMFTKLMIRMTKQKSDPTMGNKSGRTFGSEVTDPATIINDIRDGDLFPILPNFQGASASDFSMYKLVQSALSRNSVEDSFQGIDGSDPDPKKQTATQNMNDMKAQSLKVAALFDGIISGNSQLYWLRTYNIIANWTKPIDFQIDVLKKELVNKYRTVTLPSEIDGGQKATKKIVFTPNTTMTSQDIHQKEMYIKKAKKDGKKLHPELDKIPHDGSETRITYLNPEMLASIKLNWSYVCIPVPNDSDPLSYVMFAKQINDAITFFGPQSMNVKKLKHRFAKLTGNDFDVWFLSQQELDQQQQTQQAQNPAPGQPGSVPGQPVAGGPTIAGAASGAIPAQSMGSMMHV